MALPFEREIRILIIDDNNAPFILPMIRCFSGYPDIKLDVLVFSREKPLFYRYSRYLRQVYHEPSADLKNFERALKEIIIGSNIDLVIPTRERIWQVMAEHAGWLEKMVRLHPFPDASMISMLTNKLELNQWLERNGFPCSRVLPVTRNILEDLDPATLKYPVLLKPLAGAGGIGIRKVDGPGELKVALHNGKQYQKGFMIQQYIRGREIDISLFAVEGKILFYTIQRGLGSDRLSFPKSIQFVHDDRLLELTGKIISQLGYTGIAHLDFIYDPEKSSYILIDFNPRYWNSILGSMIAGINFPVLVTRYILDLPLGDPGYNGSYFYYGTSAIRLYFKNLVRKTDHPVSLKYSQLRFIFRDPLPELMFLVHAAFRSSASGTEEVDMADGILPAP